MLSGNRPSFDSPDFEQLLEGFDIEAIHLSDNIVYGLRPTFTIAYHNQGWARFSEQNGGEPVISRTWGLGRSVLDACPPILRPFYIDHFKKCLGEHRPWQHFYECSSPDMYRKFEMQCYPLGNEQGLLVVNSLVKEVPHPEVAHEPLDDLYRNEYGIATQCSHCRKVRRIDCPDQWDFIPDWVKSMPENLSHGLCKTCLGFYYSPINDFGRGFPSTFTTGS